MSATYTVPRHHKLQTVIFYSFYLYPNFQADARCISIIYSHCSANSSSVLQPWVLSMCLTYGQFYRNHNVEFSPEECSSPPLYFCAWRKLAAVIYCPYVGVSFGRKDSDDFIGNIKLHWAFSLCEARTSFPRDNWMHPTYNPSSHNVRKKKLNHIKYCQ